MQSEVVKRRAARTCIHEDENDPAGLGGESVGAGHRVGGWGMTLRTGVNISRSRPGAGGQEWRWQPPNLHLIVSVPLK